jgi:hypothetical protein
MSARYVDCLAPPVVASFPTMTTMTTTSTILSMGQLHHQQH